MFSTFLVVTIIVGAAIGGFGTPFEDLSDAMTMLFLKVGASSIFQAISFNTLHTNEV